MFNMCHIYRPPEWVAFPSLISTNFLLKAWYYSDRLDSYMFKKTVFMKVNSSLVNLTEHLTSFTPYFCPYFCVFLLFVASGYICACFSTLLWNFWKTWFYRDVHFYVFSELNFIFLTYSEVISVCALVETVIKQLTFRLVEVTLCSTGPRLPPVCDSQRSQSGPPPWRLCAGRPIQEKRQK